MDADNLRTASLYINNQLLSRGLLRNGQTVDFVRPHKTEEGLEVTMGRIMSVINDLILRKDRDSQQRENLSQTIRALRADALRSTTEMERLTTKYTEAQRKLGIADATERGLKNQLRSAEQAARTLKEEMGRMRILVGQTRAQCANEVRKKERVIEGMKKHVGEGGRPRGSGKAVGVATINVVAGVGGDNSAGAGMSTDETGYDLRMETNEFLTELARGLSEENEALGGLVRRTIETLRTMSGCEKEEEQGAGLVVQMESSYEHLASEMEFVIEHLRTILTNPSFVSLEEVEVREEEIIRLREGWEKMESRWKEAVQLMDGWRKRMARSGQTVNLEELRMGMSLSPVKPKEEPNYEILQLSTLQEEDEDEGDTQADIDAMNDSGIAEQENEDEEALSDSDSSMFEDEPADELEEEAEDDEQEDLDEASDEQQLSANATFDTVSSMPGTPPQLSPLRETQGNRGSPGRLSPKGFTTIVEENTWDLLQLEQSSPQRSSKPKPAPPPSTKKEIKEDVPQPSQSSTRSSTAKPTSRRPVIQSTPKSKPAPKLQLQPPSSSSRLPRPRDIPPQQSPLTMASIAAKLAASEREADAARVKAKLKAAKLARTASSAATTTAPTRARSPSKKEPPKDDSDPEATKKLEGRKRKVRASKDRDLGRATRRRSTLSPWELESLILGGMGSPKKEE
ncbi:NIMA interactive protein [Rutstroemia sp. NJR-2017a BBW]|nr:NIMA interactive protein [Rutstroemia sp. NJR-2017a BBW]